MLLMIVNQSFKLQNVTIDLCLKNFYDVPGLNAKSLLIYDGSNSFLLSLMSLELLCIGTADYLIYDTYGLPRGSAEEKHYRYLDFRP